MLPPATSLDQMHQVVTNSAVNGILQATFALLTLVVVASAVPVCVRALRAGGLPTTEAPYQRSELVAPADFLATPEERAALREQDDRLATAGVHRR